MSEYDRVRDIRFEIVVDLQIDRYVNKYHQIKYLFLEQENT